jgi:four helix bundle protein
VTSYNDGGRGPQVFQKLPGYRNLGAWQAASDLSTLVTQFTARLGPSHRRLANQMRGAAISVGGNIAEGYCSGILPNYIRYCNHARGSLGELGRYLQDIDPNTGWVDVPETGTLDGYSPPPFPPAADIDALESPEPPVSPVVD